MLTGHHPFEQECWTNDDYLRSDAADVAARGRCRRAIGRCSRVGCIRWDPTSSMATRSAWSATTARTGPACRGTTWACSTRPTTRGARASSDRASASRRTRSRTSRRLAPPAITFVPSHADAMDATQPFCLTVGFLLPHPPYVAWRDDYERFEGRVPPPALRARRLSPPHPWEAMVARQPRHRPRSMKAQCVVREPPITASSTVWTSSSATCCSASPPKALTTTRWSSTRPITVISSASAAYGGSTRCTRIRCACR